MIKQDNNVEEIIFSRAPLSPFRSTKAAASIDHSGSRSAMVVAEGTNGGSSSGMDGSDGVHGEPPSEEQACRPLTIHALEVCTVQPVHSTLRSDKAVERFVPAAVRPLTALFHATPGRPTSG